MPTIRTDDEVYARLQSLAQPFVDTPNSVLRRVLGLDSAPAATAGAKRGRARPGEILDRRAYDDPILEVLARRGGSAPVNEILDEVGRVVGERLTERDREILDSGVVRWRNRAMWRRLRLVEAGLLRDDSPRGVWQLSETGWEKVRQES